MLSHLDLLQPVIWQVSGKKIKLKQEMITELPQQRLVLPSEVAHTCAYLYHPNARSVTGTIQKVNGAWYI